MNFSVDYLSIIMLKYYPLFFFILYLTEKNLRGLEPGLHLSESRTLSIIPAHCVTLCFNLVFLIDNRLVIISSLFHVYIWEL